MVAKGLTGVDGAVLIDDVAVGKLRRWRRTSDRTLVDTGGFGDEWEEPDGVRKRATGSAEGVYATGDAGQQDVQDAFNDGDLVELQLQHKTGYVTAINAIINNVEEGTDYDGAATFNFQFAQHGPPISEAGHA